MSSFYGGKSGSSERSNWPEVILLGTALQFSNELLTLLRLHFDGVRFQRISDLDQMSRLEFAPKVAILHEACADLSLAVDMMRRRWARTLIAVGCSDPAILDSFNVAEQTLPVSALSMDAQIDLWLAILRLLLSGHPYVPVAAPPLGKTGPVTLTDTAESHFEHGLPGDADEPARLTRREMEILPLIAQGQQNKIIAGRLGLSVHTVKLHSHNIFTKLGVSNRTGAANWYLSQTRGGKNVITQSKRR